jgi:hypothetical protein
MHYMMLILYRSLFLSGAGVTLPRRIWPYQTRLRSERARHDGDIESCSQDASSNRVCTLSRYWMVEHDVRAAVTPEKKLDCLQRGPPLSYYP